MDRYLTLRRTLGFQLRRPGRQLHDFVRFALERGESHIRAASVLAWAALAPSPATRHDRMRNMSRLARFLHAEDPQHELLPRSPFQSRSSRPTPYIYSPQELVRLLNAAQQLRLSHPWRREVWVTLLGLLASTGLRLSEALELRLTDVLPEGVLRIRETKFRKSRLVPLHPTVQQALGRYLELRCGLAAPDDRVFLSASRGRISYSMVSWTFRRIRELAQVAPQRSRAPRIHDLRHTFATRALEKCPEERRAVARHFVALSTYLGHAEARSTYWYLEATAELMTDISSAAEALMWEDRP